MRHGLSLFTLGLGWALLTAVGCGKDEATGSSSPDRAYCESCSHSADCAGSNVCRIVTGSLGVCAKSTDTMCCDSADQCYSNLGSKIDGAGGSAGGGIIGGVAGRGGTGGTVGFPTGGNGNTGNTTTGSNLGRACVADTDCADATLTCLTNDALSGDGPPKGICTASCDPTSSDSCLDISDNAYCLSFTTSGNDGYCVEGCTEGSGGVPKCHEREEFSCSLIGTIPTGSACTATSDCKTGELCDPTSSQCGTIVTACLPTCGGDYDCGSGQYCDFSTGFCTAAKPTGLALGSPCTVPVGNATDACDGFCVAGAADPTKGTCSALCTLNSSLTGCGWDGQGAADNACLFSTILSNGDAALGDVGLCGVLCDCNSECTLKGEYCMDESMGSVSADFGRAGYCRALQQGETVADSFSTCPGSGGTGGTGGTGSGTAGEAGQGTGGSGAKGEAGAGAGGQDGK